MSGIPGAMPPPPKKKSKTAMKTPNHPLAAFTKFAKAFNETVEGWMKEGYGREFAEEMAHKGVMKMLQRPYTKDGNYQEMRDYLDWTLGQYNIP